MANKSKNCRVELDIYEKLKNYQLKTGVPISVVIDEAARKWIKDVMLGRLEALGKK